MKGQAELDGINLFRQLTPPSGSVLGSRLVVFIVPVSVMVLVVTAAVAIAAFGTVFLLTRQMEDTDAMIEKENSAIARAAMVEAMLSSTKRRLAAITALPPPDDAFLKTLQAYEQTFRAIADPETLSLDRKQIRFLVRTPDSRALEDVLETVTGSSSVHGAFSSLVIEQVVRRADGYEVAVVATRREASGSSVE